VRFDEFVRAADAAGFGPGIRTRRWIDWPRVIAWSTVGPRRAGGRRQLRRRVRSSVADSSVGPDAACADRATLASARDYGRAVTVIACMELSR